MKLPDFGEPKSLNQRVVGSSPTAPTNNSKIINGLKNARIPDCFLNFDLGST